MAGVLMLKILSDVIKTILRKLSFKYKLLINLF